MSQENDFSSKSKMIFPDQEQAYSSFECPRQGQQLRKVSYAQTDET